MPLPAPSGMSLRILGYSWGVVSSGPQDGPCRARGHLSISSWQKVGKGV